ncbi:MAG: ubiquinol oxidase subunit II [Endozoicomonas sp. (ex Botrylloides leachii)]|nr:ubiquinol oxidase subunit II [Endozoicomonas sp. (ex Botrylloides leachii)]
MNSIKKISAYLLLGLSVGLLSGCKAALLDPQGAVGQSEKNLLIISVALMMIVVVPTLFLTGYFFWKYREKAKHPAQYLPEWNHSAKIESMVWLFPSVIIVVLSVITWYSTHKLDPYRPLDHHKKPLVIQVVSLDWKWLFIYPDYGIASVGEFAFPVNRPVSFEITSDTVMSSFFIPQLGSQIYTMAGMETKLHLIADRPGHYKGVNTGYSGHGFSDMKFTAIATANDKKFDQWVDNVRHSSHDLLTQQQFSALAKPSHGYPVTYYAVVKKGLFKDIIHKFMPMSNPTPRHS